MTARYHLPNLFAFFEAAARKELPFAMWKVANCYFEGRFVTRDVGAAIHWFTRAADLGLHLAQRDLAEIYWNGIGVAQDQGQSLRLFQRAARQGDALSQLKLGQTRLYGMNVPVELTQARIFLELAEANDSREARFLLAYVNAIKAPPPFSRQEAASRLDHAAASGNAAARYALAVMHRDLLCSAEKTVWDLMTLAADEGSKEAAVAVHSRVASAGGDGTKVVSATSRILELARAGVVSAMYQLGACYERETGCPYDLEQARFWYGRAARLGNLKAKFALAETYLNVESSASGVRTGVAIHMEAAKLSYAESSFYLGFVPVVNESVVKETSASGYRLLVQGAIRGNVRAMCRLAYIHNYETSHRDFDVGMFWAACAADDFFSTGHGILGYEILDGTRADENPALAMRFLENARHLGDVEAMSTLAYTYYSGRKHVIANKLAAAACFLALADKGVADAMRNLGIMMLRGEGLARNETDGQRWIDEANRIRSDDVSSSDKQLAVVIKMRTRQP